MATFKSEEYNFDSKQSLKMEKEKKKLIDSCNYKNINNNNNLNSVNEAKDYLGCIGNNCAKIENNEVNNFKKPINSNSKQNKENKEIYKINSKISNNIFSDLFKNYGTNIIYFLYVLFVSILLTYSILEKNNINLVIILILTLIFIFYNIFFVRS